MKNKIMMIIGICTVLVVLSFIVIDGTLQNKDYAKVFNDNYIRSLNSNTEKIVASALRAGSGHNMQPWLVKIVDEENVELYADMSKTLSVVDNSNKQLLMGQGSFIKAFEINAKSYGYNVEIQYSDVDFSSSTPLIAKFILIKDSSNEGVDAISSSTAVVYDDEIQKVDLNDKVFMVFENYDTLNYKIIEEDQLTEFKNLLVKGTKVESTHEEATLELLDIFRWTEKDKNEYKYGLSLTSIPNAIKPFIQPIMKFTTNDWESFGQSSIKLFEQRLESEFAYIVVTCNNPNDLDYIKSGEVLQELATELKGYSIRPAVQVLQDIEGMEDLTKKFHDDYCDGQIGMLIVTVKDATQGAQNNPRHTVDEVLID